MSPDRQIEARAVAVASQVLARPEVVLAASPAWCATVDGWMDQDRVQVRIEILTWKGPTETTLRTTVVLSRLVTGVLLELRPLNPREVGVELLADVEIGEPDFDRYFLVDGAPTAVIRALLDEPSRRAVASLLRLADRRLSGPPCALEIDHEGLRLALHAEVKDPALLRSMAELLRGMARRLAPAVARARSTPGGAQRCDAELAEHARKRAASDRRNTIVLVALIAGVTAVLGGIAYLVWAFA